MKAKIRKRGRKRRKKKELKKAVDVTIVKNSLHLVEQVI